MGVLSSWDLQFRKADHHDTLRRPGFGGGAMQHIRCQRQQLVLKKGMGLYVYFNINIL